MTSSNGNVFRVTGPLCGEFTDPGEFPAQRPVTRSIDVSCQNQMYTSIYCWCPSNVVVYYTWSNDTKSNGKYTALITWHEPHGVSNYRKLDWVFNSVFSCQQKRKYQRSALPVFERGSAGNRWSPHKDPVIRKALPCGINCEHVWPDKAYLINSSVYTYPLRLPFRKWLRTYTGLPRCW